MHIGCGCVNIGSASANATRRDHVRLVRDAFDAGITRFDTADVYGRGESERIVGRALRDVRDEVTISTKGGYRTRPRSAAEQSARRAVARLRSRRPGAHRPAPVTTATGHDPAKDFDPAWLRSALDASLQRLGTDHVDVYHLHGPPQVIDGLILELDDLRRAGKVRRFGIGAETLAAARAWVDSGEPDVVQLPVGVLDPDGLDVVARAPEGMAMWARGALGGGVLAAAMRDPAGVADHPKRAMIEQLVAVADDAGIGVDELSLRWLGAQRRIDTVLVGISSPSHVRRNVELAAMPPLSDDVLAAIEAVIGDAAATEDRT